MSAPRVLVVSAEPIGDVMAGPAIRAAELARVLDADVYDAGLERYDDLFAAVRAHDVVVAQLLPPRLLARVWREPVRLVADFYNPTVVEVEEATRRKPARARRRLRTITALAARAHLAAADLTLCASERQAGLWRALDRRAPLALVPFGIPSQAAPSAADVRPGPLRTGLGIDADARILLWNGGVWDWLDAPTVIRAVQRLPDDVHLVFLATDRPALAARDVHPAGAAAARAAGEDPRIHFLPGWVPYAERGAYLADADLVVSAHPATREAHYAFRTRLLDAVWAAVPVVATAGDVLSEELAGAGVARLVAPGDDAAFADAVRATLADPPGAERFAGLQARMRWERAAAPLVEWIASGERRSGSPRRRAIVAAATAAQYPLLARETLASDGPRAAARRVSRNADRALRRR